MNESETPLEVIIILLAIAVFTVIFGICILLNQMGIFSGAWFK